MRQKPAQVKHEASTAVERVPRHAGPPSLQLDAVPLAGPERVLSPRIHEVLGDCWMHGNGHPVCLRRVSTG